MRTHSGSITVESKLAHGSIFRVFLPLSAEELPKKTAPISRASNEAKSGTVLVVDDEASLRKVLENAIKRLGFKVLVAQDGVEALELFRLYRSEIRLVLCDLTMPRMDGWQTLAELRRVAPGFPVILCSGYNEAHVMQGNHPEWPQAFLCKPYDLDVLKDAITRATAQRLEP